MANARKIRESIQDARDNPAGWDQRRYYYADECGTTACLAGLRCVRDGLIPCDTGYDNCTDRFRAPGGAVIPAFQWAMSSMELTEEQADTLFVLTVRVKSIDALSDVAEAIIDDDLAGARQIIREHSREVRNEHRLGTGH